MYKRNFFLGSILSILSYSGAADSVESLLLQSYRGAFVLPLVKKNNKTYVLVGKESGGRDKGTYCIPGGSSGWWIFRDTNPLDTASREFCEETLTQLNYHAARSLIDNSKQALFVDIFNQKKIVTYVVPFEKAVIDDIVQNFSLRLSATWFWQYYYREMDCLALVPLSDLVIASTKDCCDEKCWVRGLVYDPECADYKGLNITIRPILRSIVKKHRVDLQAI